MESTQKIRGGTCLEKIKTHFFWRSIFFGANFPENRNFREENITGRAGFVGPDPQFWGGLEVETKMKNFDFFKMSPKCLKSVWGCRKRDLVKFCCGFRSVDAFFVDF